MKIRIVIMLLAMSAAMSLTGCNDYAASSDTPSAKLVVEQTKKPTETPTDAWTERFTESITSADLIVYGTITDYRYEVEEIGSGENAGKSAYTIFTLTVEKTIKGATEDKEVLIKVEGGEIKGAKIKDAKTGGYRTGDVYQVPLGHYFEMNEQLLICLKQVKGQPYTVLHRGVIWQETEIYRSGAKPREYVTFQESLGRTIKTMRLNNIPIALPENERPPEPVGPTTRPPA